METPILFLIFNRPDTTRRVFEQICKTKPKILFVASDGPRDSVEGDKYLCEMTRSVVLDNINWRCEVHTLLRDKNLGCGRAVSEAISWFFDHVEEGIILEDDCLPDQSFFPYCNNLLKRFRDETSIWHIGGSNFQSAVLSNYQHSYYFSFMPHIWGWATWRDRWKNYRLQMDDFDFGAFDNYKINSQVKKHFRDLFKKIGTIDTWDYQWAFTIWGTGGLSVIPRMNLVSNIGYGENATHTRARDRVHSELPVSMLEKLHHPDIISQHHNFDEKYFARLGIKSNSFVDTLRVIKKTINKLKRNRLLTRF